MMPKAAAKHPRSKKPAKVAPRQRSKDVADRRRVASTFDVAAFHGATERTAAPTAAEWAKPS